MVKCSSDQYYSGLTLSSSIFLWNDIIYDNGNNYNVTTGGYTAPVDGIYQFSVALRMTGEWSTIEFLVDTRYVRYCETRKGYGTSLAHTSCTITISLKAGQILQTKTGAPGTLQAAHNTAPGLLFSWFGGHLLFPK